MLIKTRAIVLHPVKYGETSLIVTLYTELQGRLPVMVSGVHTKKSRFPSTFFQPLTLLETDLYFKANRDIHRLKEVSCPFHYASVPFSVSKSAVALFLAEILLHTLREEESNPPLFDFLFHAFQLLDSKDEGVCNFHLIFLIQYSRFLGIFPGGYEAGIDFIAADPVLGHMPEHARDAFRTMLSLSLSEAGTISLSPGTRSTILEALIRYYTRHLEGMGKIKSTGVLTDLFRD